MDLNAAMDRLLRLAEESNWTEWALQFAPGATVRQNFGGGAPKTVADVVAGFGAMGLAVRYENIRRVVRDGLVVEYHDARLSMRGREAIVDVALIVEFDDDGKVTSVNEYLDSAALAPLMA